MNSLRQFIPFLLLLLSFQLSHAQENLKPEFDKAAKLLQLKDHVNAEKAFTELLIKATDDKLKKFCYIYRSFCHNGTGDYKKAVADMNKAIALDPGDLDSYVDRGKSKALANDLNGARQDFLYLLTKDSADKHATTALYFLGKIAYQQKYYEQSVLYYDRYILIDSTDAEVYFNRGAAKDLLMDPAGSIIDYTKAILYRSNYKEAYANRGAAKINLIAQKKNSAAVKNQTIDACADLKKAKQLGDDTVEDLIFVHCTQK